MSKKTTKTDILAYLIIIVGFCLAIYGFSEFLHWLLGEGEYACTEFGTVPVSVDGEVRCVTWEQAPDIQEFPKP